MGRRDPDFGTSQSRRTDQLFQRQPAALPTPTGRHRRYIVLSRSQGHQGTGNRKAGVGGCRRRRPLRDPHRSASLPALVGGGVQVQPGEISLAHNGVLFLDELPEFNRPALEAPCQPMETGRAVIAGANSHVDYPDRFQFIAAMSTCRFGHLEDTAIACSRAPRCGLDYQAKISGPLFDRIDLHLDVPPVRAANLSLPPPAEGSAEIAARPGRSSTRETTPLVHRPGNPRKCQSQRHLAGRNRRPRQRRPNPS